MSCAETRVRMAELPKRELLELPHLATCAECKALADVIVDQEAEMYAEIERWLDAGPTARSDQRVPGSRWAGRLLQAALLVIAIGGSLWVASRRGPGEERPTAPTPPPPEERRAERLDVPVGGALLLQTPRDAVTIEVDDPVTRVVRLDGSARSLMVIGVAEGRTTLVVTFGDEVPVMAYEVAVRPPRTLTGKRERALQVGGSTAIELREKPWDVRVSDERVVRLRPESDTRVHLDAVGPGVADLVVLYPKGPPDILSVEVAP